MRYPNTETPVRYIKLGEGDSKRDQRCMNENIAFMHFGSNKEGMFEVCRDKRWAELYDLLLHQQGKTPGTATNLKNQFQAFVEDAGDVLWFTFFKGSLWWGFLAPGLPVQPDPELGFVRRIEDGWRCTSLASSESSPGSVLSMDDLSGRITKTAGFRGTSCTLTGDDRLCLIHRINGTVPREISEALDAREKLRQKLVGVIRRLTSQDFELLTEHIFTSAGWRRISATGKVLEVVDIVLEQPLDTCRRIFAQVKSRTSQAQLLEYVEEFEGRHALYERMYFVYHTSDGPVHVPNGVAGVVLMGPEEIADKVIDAGVVSWLIEKAR